MANFIHTTSASDLNVEVTIDLPSGFLSTEEFENALPKALKTAAKLALTYWESEAGKRLKSSRRDYQKALSMAQVSNTEVHIILGGTNMVGKKNTYVVAVELGGPKFDMKPGFMASPHTNKKKIPRAVADVLHKWPWAKPKNKWLVIPLNTERQVVFTNPKIFRTVHDNLPTQAYQHPGWKGARIHEDVVKELDEHIIPEVLGPILELL